MSCLVLSLYPCVVEGPVSFFLPLVLVSILLSLTPQMSHHCLVSPGNITAMELKMPDTSIRYNYMCHADSYTQLTACFTLYNLNTYLDLLPCILLHACNVWICDVAVRVHVHVHRKMKKAEEMSSLTRQITRPCKSNTYGRNR